jgi:hypothetical protein
MYVVVMAVQAGACATWYTPIVQADRALTQALVVHSQSTVVSRYVVPSLPGFPVGVR